MITNQLITEDEVQQIGNEAGIGLDYYDHGESIEVQGWLSVSLDSNPHPGESDGQAEIFLSYQELLDEKGGVVELRWYHQTEHGMLDSDNFDILSEVKITDIQSLDTVISRVLGEVDSL